MHLNMSLFQQPKSFWVLAFGELWSTFSYFGTQTILVLYFLHVFHITRSDSYLLYGAYAAFAYSLPILGGIIADRYLGSKYAVIIGSSLNIFGNFMLMSSHHYLFCLGLATSLIGSGLYKSSSTHLVGTLYPDGSSKKEQGFTLLYLSINVGGVLGPLVYGLVVYAVGWNFGFLCSALGILFSLIWFLSHQYLWERNKKLLVIKPSVKFFLLIGLLGTCLLLSFPFYVPTSIHTLIFTIFIISITYLISAIIKYKDQDRRRLLALLLVSFFGMFYFAAGLQIGTTITLFIQYKIQQHIITTQLPASIFSTLYPLFVLLLAPFFTYLWNMLKENGIAVSVPVKLFIGIIFATMGISAFAVAALTNLVWAGIIVGNLMLSAGELALTPAVYTAISDLSPIGMKSTMMGCWLLFIAFGGYLSSLLASASHFATAAMPFHQSEYFNEFLFIAGFTFLVALVLAAAIPKLSKMMALESTSISL